jgi:hypothetical protein
MITVLEEHVDHLLLQYTNYRLYGPHLDAAG